MTSQVGARRENTRGPVPSGVGDAPFVPVLHGIRALAVMAVVCLHLGGGVQWQTPHFGSLFQAGYLSVDTLFFTSGFVLLLPVAQKGKFGSVATFAVRRFARIAPPYYVSLLVLALAFPLLIPPAPAGLATPTTPVDYLIHFAFLHHELLGLNNGLVVDVPVWTLSIDVAFYFLFPFIAVAYLRRPLVGLLVALSVATAWRLTFIQPFSPPTHQTDLGWLTQLPLFLGDFACGMTAACLFVRLLRRPDRIRPAVVGAVAAVAAVALLGIARYTGSHLPYYLAAFQGPSFVSVVFPLTLLVFTVAIALAPAKVQWPLTNRPITWFSEISYSVYLYHCPVIFFALVTLGVPADHHFPWLEGVAVLPLCVALATVSYLLIELPSRRSGRRIGRRFADRSGRLRAQAPTLAPGGALGGPADPGGA